MIKHLSQKNQFFSYSEVERITDNFLKELRKGASATVYHGHLSNGSEVAVKKLSPSLTLGLKQFRTEVNFSIFATQMILDLNSYIY